MARGGRAQGAWVVASLLLLAARTANAQDEPAAEPLPAPPLEPAPEYGPPPPPPPAPPPPRRAPEPEPAELPPSAPRAARFGDPGVVVISANSSIGVSSTEYSNSRAKFVQALFSPGFDYFAVRGFSIGLDLEVGYSYEQALDVDRVLVETTSTSYGFGPRFGFNVPLGESVSFYPRLTVGIDSQTQDRTYPPTSFNEPATKSSATLSGGYLVLYAPLLFHPAPHFFLGAGPGVYSQFGTGKSSELSGGERTSLYGSVIVGGWWGGKGGAPSPAGPADEPFPPPEPRRPRFGGDDTWVFTGDVGASVGQSTYADSDRKDTRVSISPSVDYFVVEHFSLGVAGFVSRASRSSSGSFGTKNEVARTDVGAAARIGVDIPLGTSLSLYPRAGLSVAHQSYEAKTLGTTTDYAATGLTVALYMPLLVHFASHAFAGFGPSLSHDLTNTVEGGGASNLGTTVGAALVVGGWLSR
jgi:hypothetical protein